MAKVSTATIRLVQKLNRKNKNGEFPIYIVVCYGGRIEKATKISCLPKFWDGKHEVIKSSAPNAAVLNKTLSDLKQKLIEARNAFEEINENIIQYNVDNDAHEPLIEVSRVDMYTARHSFANHYLNSPNATVSGLASLLSRSPNTIATYVHQLTKDEEIASMVEGMVI